MESMTGYASHEGATEQFSYVMEIRSVNSKYNEFYINLPRTLRSEESDIQSLLSRDIRRGKVEMSLEITEWKDRRKIMIDHALFGDYVTMLSSIEKESGRRFTLDAVLAVDGMVRTSRSTVTERTRKELQAGVVKLVGKLRTMREREGRALQKDILASVTAIARDAAKVRKLAKGMYERNFRKFSERIAALAGAETDHGRILTEAAVLADKFDINEELVRLDDHVAKFRETVSEQTPGKKLDFLAQEMFREINTIGSKSADSQIAHLVVGLKNNVDRIREQCRNIT